MSGHVEKGPVEAAVSDTDGLPTTTSDAHIKEAHNDGGRDFTFVPELDKAQEKRIMRKIDIRVVPMVTVLYLLSFLDRGNIGNAKVLGLADDLKLIGNRYNIALMIFFFPYALLEVPANLLLKKWKPSIWLPSIMCAWGIVTIGTGFIKNHNQLYLIRVLLGIAECGQYPGCAYYLTLWYRREDLALRQGIFFSAASAAGAFSGLLAYAISLMDGVSGLAGWRWIFIIEGIVTCAVGIIAFFWIHDAPSTAKFLSEDERAWAIDRLKHRTPSGRRIQESERFDWKYVSKGILDWQVLIAIFINWGTATSIYGQAYFFPSIVNQLGYTGRQANLLTIPAYVVGCILCVSLCWLSDRLKKRSVFLLFLITGQFIGYLFAISGAAKGGLPGLIYAGGFMAISCCYPGYVLTISWILPNIAPSYKRAVGAGTLIGIGNLAGVYASNFYRTQDAPRYTLGHGMELMFVVFGFIAVNVLRFLYKRINKARDRDVEVVVAHTEEELAHLGDRAPTFRYQL